MLFCLQTHTTTFVSIIRPRRSRSAAAYSRQTFPCTICLSVCLSVQCIVENGGSDPDAVWHHRSDGSRDEASGRVWRSVHGKGYFWGRIWITTTIELLTLQLNHITITISWQHTIAVTKINNIYTKIEKQAFKTMEKNIVIKEYKKAITWISRLLRYENWNITDKLQDSKE